MSLHVVDAGAATRVVDLGRPKARSLGLPLGGAADRASFLLGNALVGNPPNAAALEICLKGPSLRAEADLACVLFGAPFALASARQLLKPDTTFTFHAGEKVHVGGTSRGLRAYLCVRGGLKVADILGSLSALENCKAGDILACEGGTMLGRSFPPAVLEALVSEVSVLRVLPGLQADWFDEPAFFDQEFTVTPALDRMGIRLQGRPLLFPERELISEPVCPGAVQVTPVGQAIVLGVDGQTIGGYPKIAQVIQADLDRLGQLRPGQRLRFQKVGLDEAFELFQARQQFLRDWTRRAHLSLDGK